MNNSHDMLVVADFEKDLVPTVNENSNVCAQDTLISGKRTTLWHGLK